VLDPTAPDFALLLTEISRRAGRSANRCRRTADTMRRPAEGVKTLNEITGLSDVEGELWLVEFFAVAIHPECFRAFHEHVSYC